MGTDWINSLRMSKSSSVAVDQLDATFAAFAEPTRRKVLELLGDGPRRASDLAAASGLKRPAMSRHLRVLRTSGLVDVELSVDDARERLYRLRHDQFVSARSWLDQMEAFWSDQLDRFKTHAERKR